MWNNLFDMDTEDKIIAMACFCDELFDCEEDDNEELDREEEYIEDEDLPF